MTARVRVWPARRPGSIITEMKRATVYTLCVLLLAAVTGQVTARYDCRITGAKDQASCCCKNTADSAVAQCGCCNVRYQDNTPEVVQAKFRATDDQGILVVELVSEASAAVLDPSALAPHALDDPGPPLDRPRRHILFCSFLC